MATWFLKGVEVCRFVFDACGWMQRAQHVSHILDDGGRTLAKMNLMLDGGTLFLQFLQIPIPDCRMTHSFKRMEGFTRAMSFYFMTECPFLSYLADRGRRWEVFEEMGANGLAVFRNLVEVDQIKYAEILSLNSEEFNKVILARDGKIFHNEDGRVKACNGAHHPTREEIQNLQRFAVVTANVVSVAELVVKADKFRREIKEFLNRMPQELIAMVPEMNPHDPFNLLLCDVIPNDLEDDPVFAAHRCPITGRAIRFPVRDRHHPEHVYERAAIQQWLIDHPSSPLTRELMLLEDLELCPEIQETIDHHLTIYVQLMRDYLHERLAAPHGAQ